MERFLIWGWFLVVSRWSACCQSSAHIGQFSPLHASSGFVVHPAIWILSVRWGWLRQQKPFEFIKSHCPGREPPSSRKGRVLSLQIVWCERTAVRARDSLDPLLQHLHIVRSTLTSLTKRTKAKSKYYVSYRFYRQKIIEYVAKDRRPIVLFLILSEVMREEVLNL